MLIPLHALLRGSAILLGGQDCSSEPKGAHTGDISAPMLSDAGCRMVIVGHSERRHGHGESDALVRAKAAAAHAAGLTAILCIGETEDEWLAGRTLEVLDRQLEGSLPAGATADNLILAYEPVWAIGTGRTPERGRDRAHPRPSARAARAPGRRRASAYASCTAARSRRPMPARSWRSSMSMARWSAAPAWMPAEFWAIYEAGPGGLTLRSWESS